MILHPGILSLLAGSAIVCAMVLYASYIGVRILVQWDFSSSSSRQLELERRTSLISVILGYALGFEIVSCLLFVFTVEGIHPLFVGAMCATGSLNANPIGWYALLVKVVLFFLAGFWIVLNSFDQRAPDFPLIRKKYALLLALAPLVAADLYLQVKYFGGLEPEVITSCCGSLFSEGGAGAASEVAGLPVAPAMAVFFSSLALFLVSGAICLRTRLAIFRYLFSAIALSTLVVSLAAVISFLSLYIYEIPTHHCPFDVLQSGYHFIGYPLYGSLFAGAFFGMLPGLFRPLGRIPSLTNAVRSRERTWIILALVSIALFSAISLWKILGGTFTLRG